MSIAADHRFGALDGWRGVCACLVAVMHFHVDSHAYENMFLRHSGLFVDFFFVLSGFVISHAYSHKLATGAELRSFMIRRFGRLWPLHVVVLCALVGATVAKSMLGTLGVIHDSSPMFEGAHNWPAIFSNLLLIQALGIHDDDSWNAPSWSISVEFYTYLIFGLACYVASLRFRRLPWLAAALIALSAAAIVFWFSPHLMETTYDFGLWRCIYGFFTGHLAYRAWQVLSRTVRSAAAGWLEVPLVVLVACFVSYVGSGETALLAPLVFAVAIVCFAFEGGKMSALLLTRPFEMLGKYSYSIYMVHAFIIHCLMIGIQMVQDASAPLIRDMAMPGQAVAVPTLVVGSRAVGDMAIVVYIGVVVATAGLTYRLVEEPGRRFFNRLARRVEVEPVTRVVAAESGPAS